MKKPVALLLLTMCFYACAPKPQNNSVTCLQGKLVKRGICGQRVIELLSQPVEGVAMASEWTDSLSGKKYEHVFTVANPCDFPAAIKEGEIFTFSITTQRGSDCATCYAYTPVPGERNLIVTGCPQ